VSPPLVCVVSSLGIRVPGRATIPLGTLFTHIASPASQRQETGVQKGSFRAFSCAGPAAWNRLPETIRQAQTQALSKKSF